MPIGRKSSNSCNAKIEDEKTQPSIYEKNVTERYSRELLYSFISNNITRKYSISGRNQVQTASIITRKCLD